MTDTPTDTVETQDDGKANKEAAKYRRQLREAESERDALRAKLEARERADIERECDDLCRPADFFEFGEGITLDALRNEDGEVDAERVTARLEALKQSNHYLFKPDPTAGVKVSTGPPARGADAAAQGITWQEAITSEA